MMKQQKIKVNKNTVLRLSGYIFRRYKIRFAFVVILVIISSLAFVHGTMFTGTLIDEFITPFIGGANHDYSSLASALFELGLIHVVGIISTWGYARIMVTIAHGTLKNIRDDLFAKMQTLPIEYFDTHQHGDIMSVYTNDIDTLRQMISQSFPKALDSVFTLVSVFTAMLIISPSLTGLVLVLVVVMLRAMKLISSKSSKFFVSQQKNIGEVNGYIEEMIEGQKVIKTFCYEDEAIRKFDLINDRLCETSTSANKLANILMPVMGNIGNTNYVVTLIIGAIITISGFGGLTLGGLAAFLQYTRQFNMPIAHFSQEINAIIMALAGAERVFELMDQEPEKDDGTVELVNAVEACDGTLTESAAHTGIWAWKLPSGAGKYEYVKLCGDIIFDNVSFGYSDEELILKGINLYAKPSQKIAFVGHTGAGKTTITNLINRFYDIQHGQIRVDGIDIKMIKKPDLRRSIAVVLQDTHLFSGTVKENIRYGKLDATNEEVYAAAKLANADGFIKHLPHGYDTVLVGDEGNLSQGQRQLLSIARAAIADPPILVLDEATSNIDTRTERIVQDGMDKLMEGRTVFAIAHRLSTIKNSNVIMVIDDGEIIERGDHDSLLQDKGVYYHLHTGTAELS